MNLFVCVVKYIDLFTAYMFSIYRGRAAVNPIDKMRHFICKRSESLLLYVISVLLFLLTIQLCILPYDIYILYVYVYPLRRSAVSCCSFSKVTITLDGALRNYTYYLKLIYTYQSLSASHVWPGDYG